MLRSKKLPVITSVKDLAGKYVLVRTSYNVPIHDGEVRNQFRILRSLATIDFLTKAGAKVVVISHLSNNKKTEQEETLAPVFEALKGHFPNAVFSPEVATPKSMALRDEMENGDVLLLENLRQDPREKKNDADFARVLADFADLYVNNDFAVSHRAHASTAAITEFVPSYVGLNFQHEYDELKKAMKPKRKALFMLGGAKFDTKLPLVEKYLKIYDQVFIGGALANDFFVAKGYEVGTSLVSDVSPDSLAPILAHKKLLLPIDVTVIGDNGVRTCPPNEVEPHEAIMDAGPDTTAMLGEYISTAKTILWNGPFGNYEKGFATQTEDTARRIAASDAYSIIGGGDTITAIESLNNQDKFSFLSTAGGAMLTFLELGTLPAIDAIKASAKK